MIASSVVMSDMPESVTTLHQIANCIIWFGQTASAHWNTTSFLYSLDSSFLSVKWNWWKPTGTDSHLFISININILAFMYNSFVQSIINRANKHIFPLFECASFSIGKWGECGFVPFIRLNEMIHSSCADKFEHFWLFADESASPTPPTPRPPPPPTFLQCFMGCTAHWQKAICRVRNIDCLSH